MRFTPPAAKFIPSLKITICELLGLWAKVDVNIAKRGLSDRAKTSTSDFFNGSVPRPIATAANKGNPYHVRMRYPRGGDTLCIRQLTHLLGKVARNQ